MLPAPCVDVMIMCAGRALILSHPRPDVGSQCHAILKLNLIPTVTALLENTISIFKGWRFRVGNMGFSMGGIGLWV